MIVLGIETATTMCSAALADENGVIGEYRLLKGYSHAERLPGAVESLLSDAKFISDEIDGIAVSIGPGSFTGLRIGLGFAKGLAMAWEKPLVAVPTMAGILARVPVIYKQACVMLTARRGEVYLGLFKHTGDSWQAMKGAHPVSVEGLPNHLPEGELMFAGEGLLSCREWFADRPDSLILPDDLCLASGLGVAMQGLDMLQNGETADVDTLAPVYIKRFQGMD